ncbi:MAG TPA: DUF805 domain-containing protein [Bacillales bacterium]|nr:DUF805 domain-containing protein [Bacillales bacterium]
MEWYLKVIKNYAVIQGRARRKEYWMFTLFNGIIIFVLAIIEFIIGLKDILTGLYVFAVFLPSLAVNIRRLHDTGRSGWWFLISLIPLIGPIVLLVFTCLDGQPNDNEYGENPKAA